MVWAKHWGTSAAISFSKLGVALAECPAVFCTAGDTRFLSAGCGNGLHALCSASDPSRIGRLDFRQERAAHDSLHSLDAPLFFKIFASAKKSAPQNFLSLVISLC